MKKILLILNIVIAFLTAFVLAVASVSILAFALFGGSFELTINNPFFP